MPRSLQYTDAIDESWSLRAVNLIRVSTLPDVGDPVLLELVGLCPRCGDETRDEHWLQTFSGAAAMKPEDIITAIQALRSSGVVDTPRLPVEFSVQCRCDALHPDPLRRRGLHGCGAVWRMRIEVFDEDDS